LQAAIDLLTDMVLEGMSMIDVGCGTGRHLTMLRNRLRTGVAAHATQAVTVSW
jgi:ubiquinone/menaquinone biosynthesis C-methylase UbiE